MDKLTPEMKESFYDIPTLYKKMEDGYERHYLKIVAFHNGKKMAHGLACVNVDQTLQNGHRAFIRRGQGLHMDDCGNACNISKLRLSM